MLRNFVFVFALIAIAAAFAGTVPGHVPGCSITLLEPSVVQGLPLAKGDYRVTVNIAGDKATFVAGKTTVTVDVKVDNVPAKYDSTAVRFVSQAGNQVISEIRIGGSKVRLLFD